MNQWSFFCAKWLNPRCQNSIWQVWVSLRGKSNHEAESKNEWVKFFCARWLEFKMDCHHQVELEWMSDQSDGISFSAKWLNPRVPEFNMCFCEWVWEEKLRVNLREDNKSQNEWVKFFCAKWLNSRWKCHHLKSKMRMNDSSVRWN